MTPETVADLTRTNVRTVMEWGRSGVLRPVRLTRKTIRFNRQDVMKFLNGIDPSNE
jgi:excisionase family DNA binding protein